MESNKAIIKSTDMSEDMQTLAADCFAAASQKYKEEREMAKYVKKEFDKRFGGIWQCIVGKDFGCYVSHKPNTFIYFHLNDSAVLLFHTVIQPK